MRKVLIVGIGNIGNAVARGLIRHGENLQLHLADHRIEPLAALQADMGGDDEHEDVELKTYSHVSDCQTVMDAILLCVKPQDLSTVAASINDAIGKQTMIVSVLAGTSLNHLSQEFGSQQPLARAMPNIAALVRESPTVVCHNDPFDQKCRSFAAELLNSIGSVHWTTENKLDAVTGLSGSGPAYIYMVIESLTDGGVKMGLPRALALNLAIQTAIGAGKLVQESENHPAILRDKVTTPGGTTIDAIYELESKGLRAMLISAVATAAEKSRRLNSE